jgi:hypothetical protein
MALKNKLGIFHRRLCVKREFWKLPSFEKIIKATPVPNELEAWGEAKPK